MGYLSKAVVGLTGDEAYRSGVSDLMIVETANGEIIYTTSGPMGGLLAWDAQTLDVVRQYEFANNNGLARPIRMERTELNGQDTLLVYGANHSGLSGYEIDTDGSLGDIVAFTADQEDMLTAMVVLPALDGGVAVTASASTGGLQSWVLGADGAMTPAETVAVGPKNKASDIYFLNDVSVGAQIYVVALSGSTGEVLTYDVNSIGQFTLMDSAGGEDGLSLSYPALMTFVEIGGVTTMIVAGQGSSTLAVMTIEANGQLVVTDQVMDDLDTRFQAVTVLESVVHNGKVYVVAGGGDDGLSLMTLLPTGRLLHLETIADDMVMALTDPSALELVSNGNKIDMYVVGRDDDEMNLSGVTKIEIDPGAGGSDGSVRYASGQGGAVFGTSGADQMIGNQGDDRLFGGAGDDILFDGSGQDTLYGGAGADVFVFGEMDGKKDVIGDFELGVDRIDISQMGRIYSIESLTIESTPTGATVDFRGDVFRIISQDSQSLSAADFNNADFFDLTHLQKIMVQVGDQSIHGGDGQDTLTGGDGDDVIVGGKSGDDLSGGAGADVLVGEFVDGEFDAAGAQAYRLYLSTLARSPDQEGHSYWTEMLMSGGSTIQQVAAGFTNSREFKQTYGAASNEEFIELLYQNVLDRAADSAGLAGWLDVLEDGSMTRPDVVVGFSESAEFRKVTAGEVMSMSRAGHQADWLDDVFRLYQATLDRAPDEGGAEHWSYQLASGVAFETVVGGFVKSAEFQARYGTVDDGGFVKLLYQNVLDRSADEGGYVAWTAALENGMQRATVVKGFAQSQEFVQNTIAPTFDWVQSKGLDDRLNGGEGDNILFGGRMSDEFRFNANDAQSTVVVDFESWDVLAFEDFGYTHFSDALSHMVQIENDVVFQDQNVSVRLLNTDLEDVEEADFWF